MGNSMVDSVVYGNIGKLYMVDYDQLSDVLKLGPITQLEKRLGQGSPMVCVQQPYKTVYTREFTLATLLD